MHEWKQRHQYRMIAAGAFAVLMLAGSVFVVPTPQNNGRAGSLRAVLGASIAADPAGRAATAQHVPSGVQIAPSTRSEPAAPSPSLSAEPAQSLHIPNAAAPSSTPLSATPTPTPLPVVAAPPTPPPTPAPSAEQNDPEDDRAGENNPPNHNSGSNNDDKGSGDDDSGGSGSDDDDGSGRDRGRGGSDDDSGGDDESDDDGGDD